MGKIRIKALGDEEREKKQKQKDEARREGKKLAKQKTEPEKSPAKTDEKNSEPIAEKIKTEEKKEAKETVKENKTPNKTARIRSKRYQKKRSYIDKTKLYAISEAITLIKKTSLSRFDGSVELHVNTFEKGLKGSVSLPHGTGKQIRVAIVDDELLAQVEKGKVNFDVLISHPSFMPKLAKLAKILGPKGLMPNPKNGTISDKPEETAKKYAGSLQFKTEPDFPIIHATIGKVSFDDKKLSENFAAFIKAVDPLKIKSVYLKSTMSPSVKVDVTR